MTLSTQPKHEQLTLDLGIPEVEEVNELIQHQSLKIERNVPAQKLLGITSSTSAAEIASNIIGGYNNEHVLTLMLNTKNKIIGYHINYIGSNNSCIFEPKGIIQTALVTGATQIIVAHNHPSGDPEPSSNDLRSTRRLEEACDLIGLPLLDHIIVTDDLNVYTSLADEGIVRCGR